MAIAITIAMAIMAVAASAYLLLVHRDATTRFNGAAIVAAARAYTRDLNSRNLPVPASVSLDDLVSLHFLKATDVAAFRGMKASVTLTSKENGLKTVLMRVKLPDGGDIVLLGDGSVQQTAP